LSLATQATASAMRDVGFQAAIAIHMSTVHKGGFDHQLQADGAFELALIQNRSNSPIF